MIYKKYVVYSCLQKALELVRQKVHKKDGGDKNQHKWTFYTFLTTYSSHQTFLYPPHSKNYKIYFLYNLSPGWLLVSEINHGIFTYLNYLESSHLE